MERSNVTSMVLPVHRLTPYLRVRIFTGERSIRIEDRPSLLGFIPLRKRRLEIPFAELDSHRFKTVVRFDSLVAAIVAVAMIFVLHPATWAIVTLAVGAVLMVPFAAPNKAVVVRRADSRTWTIRFCRDYEFDANLALADAEQRRDTETAGRPRAA